MISRRSVETDLNRIREQSDALLVLIIHPDWGYVSTDPKLAPKDAIETLRNEIPMVAEYLNKKAKTR